MERKRRQILHSNMSAINIPQIHARLGEVLYMAASTSEGSSLQHLTESVKRFSRSIELCDDYLRGYYGLKLVSRVPNQVHQARLTDIKVTNKLIKEPSKPSKQPELEEWSLPDVTMLQNLNELATKKLAEIVRRNGAQERLWQGYDESEVAAARDLLSKESAELVR